MFAIIGADADAVRAAVESTDGAVDVANYNEPGQTVIAGAQAPTRAAAEKIEARKIVELPVSAPFHCSLMAPAGDRLARVLAEIQIADPLMPVVANVDTQTYQTAGELPDRLVRQVSQPVQWRQSVLALGEMGIDHFVEVGPSRVLLGLIRRILPGAALDNVEDPASVDKLAGGV